MLTFEYYGPDGWKELTGVTATQDEAKLSQVYSTTIPREGRYDYRHILEPIKERLT